MRHAPRLLLTVIEKKECLRREERWAALLDCRQKGSANSTDGRQDTRLPGRDDWSLARCELQRANCWRLHHTKQFLVIVVRDESRLRIPVQQCLELRFFVIGRNRKIATTVAEPEYKFAGISL